MDSIWDKLDRYTTSDYLYSSDEDHEDESYFQQTEYTYISNKNIYETEAGYESVYSDDVEDIGDELTKTRQTREETVEKVEIRSSIYENLLDEMKKSELHYNSDTRNVQEKIDEISAEKSQKKDEPNEMQNKAQVISSSARMSATEVLSTITNSETIDHEESGQMDEYYERIRSTDTGDDQPEQENHENERKSTSSDDVDLPNITPISTTLNTGFMKSKANVARQGSMKARRKPTAVKRKSWPSGMDIQEENEITEDNEHEDVWVTTQTKDANDGLVTPSDSSSEDEKEVVKPHLRSGVALPGLGDALKIQMTRSELKRPTALSLAITAKEAKDNEVTKENKIETSPSKPEWMKEVEERKKNPRASPQRRHKTLPSRCSELDTMFEQRKQVHSTEGLDPMALKATDSSAAKEENMDPELRKKFERRKNVSTVEVDGDGTILEPERPRSFHAGQIDSELSKMFEKRKQLSPLDVEGGGVVKNVERPKSFHGDLIDPELSKMFEKRKNLAPLEVKEEGSGVVKETERPKSFHGDQIDPELSKMFEKRKNLRPLEVDGSPSSQGDVAKEAERPKSLHGDQIDSELSRMFERRNNLKPVEGSVDNKDDGDGHVFKPRNVHLKNSQATELDKAFEKRKQLCPVEGVKSHTPQGKYDESSTTAIPSSDLRQTSGIVRARFHDTKLEPLPGRGEVKVATVAQVVEVRTTRHENTRKFEAEKNEAHPVIGSQSGHSKPHPPPTTAAQIAEFTFDGRGAAAHATIGHIPSGNPKASHPPTTHNIRQEGAQVKEFVFDGKGASRATVSRVPGNQRGNVNTVGQQQGKSTPNKRVEQETVQARVAQFVFDDSAAAAHATVGRIPGGGSQAESMMKHGSRKTSPPRADSYSDQVIGSVDSRGDLSHSSDVNSKHAVISTTSSFIEQLSRKQVSGQAQAQGKFVSKPSSRNNLPDYKHNKLLEQRVQEEYPLPRRYHHGNQQIRSSQDNTAHRNPPTSPPSERSSRNLPPINSEYLPTPPSKSLDHRSFSHSHSYPSNTQFSDYPPSNAKTSEPGLSYSPHTPKTPKEGGLTSPRSVKVREIKGPVRNVDSKEDEVRLHSQRNLRDMGKSVDGRPDQTTEFKRNSRIKAEVDGTTIARNDGKPDNTVNFRNAELSTVSSHRSAGSYNFNEPYDKENDRRYRVRSPRRPEPQNIHKLISSDSAIQAKISRVRSPERCENPRGNASQNSARFSDRKVTKLQSSGDASSYKNSYGLQDPRSSDTRDIWGMQNPYRAKSPERSDFERVNKRERVKSPERSEFEKISKTKPAKSPERSDLERISNLERSNHQVINRLQSTDNSGESRLNRIRSPERANDGERIHRVRSPERSGDPRIRTVQSPGNAERKSRITTPRRLDVRGKDDRVLKDRIRDINESSNSSQNRSGYENFNKRNSGNFELISKPNTSTSDAISYEIQNDKNYENRSRGLKNASSSGQRNIVLSGENVERPKPVTVKVMSLSESPVYVKSPVIGQVRSHDRGNMSYDEYMVNGVVNGDVERRGGRNERDNFDVQSSQSATVPLRKQELQQKKRLQSENLGRQEEILTRKKGSDHNIQSQQSGNDMAEWQKRLQGIRKTWGVEENEDAAQSKEDQTTSRGDRVSDSDEDRPTNVPDFLKEFQQKKNNKSSKGSSFY